jgi:chaperone modulatory protein CbpM
VTSYALVRAVVGDRPPALDLDSFARAAGLHPDLVRRLVALGLLEPTRDAAGTLWFPPAQILAAARVQRLRAGLALNYAAIGVVIDLLDRIAELEAALRQAGRSRVIGGQPWT